jgi:autotransporter-associated beta strand protein
LAGGSYNGQNISNAGGGATTVNVSCSGTVTACNSVDNFYKNASMGTNTNFSTGAFPSSANDVGLTTLTAAVTLAAANITAQSFNVTNTSTYTITNTTTTATNSNLTLGNGVFTNCISGNNNDIIYLYNATTAPNLTIIGPNGSTGTGVLNFVLAGSGNFNVGTGSTLDISSIISGAFAITITGSGITTLEGANTFTGGITLDAAAEILNINNIKALGTTAGTFTINGGTFDNTSGGTITTQNYPQAWNNDFTFTGTNPLNLGTGNVTLNTTPNITVSSMTNTLTVGGVISGAYGITKLGINSTLKLTNTANTYTGVTTITEGTLLLNPASAATIKTSQIDLDGGILSTSGIASSANITGSSTTLNLTDISTIALGSNAHTITFAESDGITWTSGKILTITGWVGTAGGAGSNGRIFFGNSSTYLTSSQLAQITFAGYGGAMLLGTGELVPKAPSIAISSPGLPAAGNIGQGTTNNILYELNLAVTNSNATLTGVTITTAAGGGTYSSPADILNFKLWYNTSATLTGATQLGSTVGTDGSGTSPAFSGLSQNINSGTTGYLFITCDVAAAATIGHKINITTTALANITFSAGTKTGADPAIVGNTQTITVPNIVISSPGPAAGNIGEGTTNNILYELNLAVTNANATLTGVTVTTGGTYATTDVINFKLWYNTSATLTGATQLGSTVASKATGLTLVYNGLSQNISSATTGYLFITGDVAAAAVVTKTINIAATPAANITFSAGTESGSGVIGTTQTITGPSIAISSPGLPVVGNINPGTTNNILYQLNFVVTSASATLTGLTVTTAGTYATTDVINFKLWYNISSATLAGATQLGSTIASDASGSNLVFSGLSQLFPIGTEYLLVTGDVASGAVATKTINITTTAFTNIIFSAGTKTGTSPAVVGNAQTITGSTASAAYIVDEGFTSSGSNSAALNSGFTFSGSPGIYSGGSNFGRNSPSVSFSATGQYIQYHWTSGPADHIAFLYKGETSTAGSIIVQESPDGSAWTSVGSKPVSTITTAATFDYSLLSGSRYVRITSGNSNNFMLDDFRIRSAGVASSTPLSLVLEMINGECGSCEGYNEFVAFKTGSNALSVPYFELVNPTMTYGNGALAMGGNGITASGSGGNNNTNTNWILYSALTTNQTNYTSSLNTTAGCTIFHDIPSNNIIPANSNVIAFTGCQPDAPYNFSSLCGDSYYVIYSNECSGCTGSGKYGNTCSANCTRFMTIFNHQYGDISNKSFTTPATTKKGDSWDFIDNVGVTSNCAFGSSPLPIDLLTFTANCNTSQTVDINWSTASESNNDYYTVERSNDGETWAIVAVMPGAGNSNTKLYYSAIDSKHYSDNTYYRLKQTDFNGNFKYFDPVVASCNSNNVVNYFKLKPNPAIDEVTCSIVASENNDVTIEVINYLGQKIYFRNFNLLKGSNDFKVDVSQYNDGVYTVIVYSANGNLLDSKQLVVQKR